MTVGIIGVGYTSCQVNVTIAMMMDLETKLIIDPMLCAAE
jgi:hypothetical protein